MDALAGGAATGPQLRLVQGHKARHINPISVSPYSDVISPREQRVNSTEFGDGWRRRIS